MTDKAKEQAFERAQERAAMNYNAWCAGAINLQPDESRFFFDAGYAAALASRPAELQKYASVIYDIETRCMLYNGTTVAREVLGLLESAGYVNARGFANHPAVAPQPKTEPCTCNAQRDGDMQWTHAPNCPRSESWQRRVAKDASAQPKTEERKERITHSAIISKNHGELFALSLPASHYAVAKMMTESSGIKDPLKHDQWEQGFYTSASRYVGRREAKIIAKAAGQIVNPITGGADLFSEELWTPVAKDASAAPLQAPTDEGGSDFAWLIERTDGPIPTYWDGRATRNNHGPRVTYHHDANSAVRFARQEDAERIIAWLLEGEPVVAREHGWFRATAAPSDPQPEKCDHHFCLPNANRCCKCDGLFAAPIPGTDTIADHLSDPQPSEQEEEAAFRTWRDQNGLASHRAAFDAGREYERKHRPAIDIEDIIKHCRLSLDGKSVSLPELRKALQKATGKEKVNGE